MGVIQSKLLSLGGDKIASQNLEEEKLQQRGQIIEYDEIILRKMIESECHYNSAQLLVDHRKSEYDGELQMWTGLALSSDGIWREHSWLVTKESTELFPIRGEGSEYGETNIDSNTIIETTRTRELYFGYPVEGEEFDRMAHMLGAF
jgi:hypothetical protein